MEPQPPLASCCRDGEDLISSLPDDLLHAILIRLPSAAAAARTSVLSRRWRGVWSHMPELAICVRPRGPAPATPSAVLDSVDAALNSYARPTLGCLKIDVTLIGRFAADRIAPWLRFASQRLAGKLRLSCWVDKPAVVRHRNINVEELALPVCERATEIKIDFFFPFSTDVVLRPPPTGSFSALTDLRISCTRMDGGELGRLVSSPQCPRLQKLHIFVAKLAPVGDVSICSESLECLNYRLLRTRKLEVNAPLLRKISVSRAAEACIVAPKLEKVEWSDTFNPGIHQFLPAARRHLQSLDIRHSSPVGTLRSSSAGLMERYDTVKELKVSLKVNKEIAGYMSFLTEMDKLPICESLLITLMANHHALPAMMLHLLRRCICIRKLKLSLDPPTQFNPPKVTPCSISGCPCLLPENYRLDGIAFDSLEEIRINFFTASDEQEQFLKLLLSKCNIVTLKRVDIMVPFDFVSSEIMKVVKRIRGVCHRNSKVQFNVLPLYGRRRIHLPPRRRKAIS